MAFLNDSTIIAPLISGIFALISGFIALSAYKSKKKFEVKFDKELENHKSWLEGRNKEIQSQLDTKLELLRIEYGTIFIKRLDVIEEIYDHLLQVQKLYSILYSHDKSKEMNAENVKRVRETSDSFKQFWDYFERKKIYLSEDLASVITYFLMLVSGKLYEKYPDEMRSLSISEGISEKEISAFMGKLLNIFEGVKPTEILNALENEFRTLIGIEVTSKNI